MTEVEQLAYFISEVKSSDIAPETRRHLQIRVLDSLGVAIGALDSEPIQMIKKNTDDFGGNPLCTLIGGQRTSPDRATFYNGALVRYLDFMDSYLAPGETFHPSDNLSAVLASCEYMNSSGEEFLTSLAIAYEVQIRLSEAAPVRAKGFDHTTQGAYAVAAGASKALQLTPSQTASALAISGTANNALRVTRTGKLSHWKGLAYPHTAFAAIHSTFLAKQGITGPLEIFEGNKGFKDSIAGHFRIDWKNKNFENISKSIIKKYNAEIHSQSSIEGVLELQNFEKFNSKDIDQIEVEIFQVAFDIIGGGAEGNKTDIHTKEEADHSLPYMISAALLDQELTPVQYQNERIQKKDVQDLLKRIKITPRAELSERFPNQLPVKIKIILKNGQTFHTEKKDYEGFHTRPTTWEQAIQKFKIMSSPHTHHSVQAAIINKVEQLPTIQIRELTTLLSNLKQMRK